MELLHLLPAQLIAGKVDQANPCFYRLECQMPVDFWWYLHLEYSAELFRRQRFRHRFSIRFHIRDRFSHHLADTLPG